MCSAFFHHTTLARTTDRQGALDEHSITAGKNMIGGTIVTPQGKIWIDGINASGLMIALLNYRKEMTAETAGSSYKIEIHPGRLIPAVLESCANAETAAGFLQSVTLTADEPEMYPHFILADKAGNCAVFEDGQVIQNPLGILTNAPSFTEQLQYLPDLSADSPAIPWNYSSEARFRHLAWLKKHVRKPQTYTDFMNILDTVSVPDGADPRKNYRTLVKTVMSADEGVYAFCTEANRTVRFIRFGETGEFPLI